MTLRDEIQTYHDFMAEHYDGSRNLHYRNDLDLVLQHGQEFQSVPWKTWRGRGYRRGKVRECFKNAFDLSYRSGLTYVEGFASSGGLPMIHHAWLVDPEGRVVDPTWRDNKPDEFRRPVEEWEYFGVPFEQDFVVDVLVRKNTYGVLDDFKIYEQPLPDNAVRELTRSAILAETNEGG